ncbi:hypothetical protein E4U21_000215 [Claviceps maximensis]|nr:hypothetical protein E4U21_000215 [Claviceps maximensis]
MRFSISTALATAAILVGQSLAGECTSGQAPGVWDLTHCNAVSNDNANWNCAAMDTTVVRFGTQFFVSTRSREVLVSACCGNSCRTESLIHCPSGSYGSFTLDCGNQGYMVGAYKKE